MRITIADSLGMCFGVRDAVALALSNDDPRELTVLGELVHNPEVLRIRARYPQAAVKFVDTVCQPTKERQEAARRLAAEADVMVVIGGRTSNNTLQLARTCAAEGATTYQVENASDLRADWFAGV